MRKYKNVSDATWLRFPDGQEVGPGQEFERDYDPEQLFHHKIAGIVEEAPVEEVVAESPEAAAPKRSRRTFAMPAVAEEGGGDA